MFAPLNWEIWLASSALFGLFRTLDRRRTQTYLLILLFGAFLAFVHKLYRSNLSASRIVPLRHASPIQSLTQLASLVRDRRLSMIFASKDYIDYRYIQTATKPGVVRLRKALRFNPPEFSLLYTEICRRLQRNHSLVALQPTIFRDVCDVSCLRSHVSINVRGWSREVDKGAM